MSEIILFNKPFNVLSQFTDVDGRKTLANYIDLVGFYPAGRLDRDSEGLLLLTDDGHLQHLISHPRHKMDKTYWVQVEGEITISACKQLMSGVELKDGKAHALNADPMIAPDIWAREPPVRFRQAIPTSWIKMTINEGRNRQVRRMTAAVGFPTLRLIRFAIGNWNLQDILPGQWVKIEPDSELLALANSPKWAGKEKAVNKGSKRRQRK